MKYVICPYIGNARWVLNVLIKKTSARWFKVTFLGKLSDLLERLSDLQLGGKKVTKNHLVVNLHHLFPWICIYPWDSKEIPNNFRIEIWSLRLRQTEAVNFFCDAHVFSKTKTQVVMKKNLGNNLIKINLSRTYSYMYRSSKVHIYRKSHPTHFFLPPVPSDCLDVFLHVLFIWFRCSGDEK